MKTVTLQKQNIHSGNLILVNREYGYRESGEEALAPAPGPVPNILMQRRALVLLSNLMEEIDGWRSIVPVSGWRSGEEQQEIWDSSLAENGREFTQKYVAYPGHSEHQTGLAIDLGLKKEVIDFICPDFPYEGICQVFRQKAAEYGFIERYPSGKEEITGIGHEPWHFRYVGIPHAVIMARRNLALEEYISYIKSFPYGQAACKYLKKGQEISVSYLEAEKGETTSFEIDENNPCSISGNNVDGFIITQWNIEMEKINGSKAKLRRA